METSVTEAALTIEHEETFPVFKDWKGELAQEVLKTMWIVSDHNKDFIQTMIAENGSFDPYLKHPNRNKDGSWDYSFGLNSYYHQPFINKILNKEVGIEDIVKYHYNIYQQRHGAFYGYYKRNNANIKKMIIYP